MFDRGVIGFVMGGSLDQHPQRVLTELVRVRPWQNSIFQRKGRTETQSESDDDLVGEGVLKGASRHHGTKRASEAAEIDPGPLRDHLLAVGDGIRHERNMNVQSYCSRPARLHMVRYIGLIGGADGSAHTSLRAQDEMS